jgi:undecaprenyl-diphosphatase
VEVESTVEPGRAHHLLELEHTMVCSIGQAIASPAIIGVMRMASRYGDWGLSVTVGLLLLGCCGWRTFAAWLGATAVALILQKQAKIRFGRRRPCEHSDGPPQRAPIPDKGSFPSGHTLHAALGAVFMTTMVPAVAPGFIAIAVLIGASRVVLGVHYPSDVAAGGTLGGLLAVIALTVS